MACYLVKIFTSRPIQSQCHGTKLGFPLNVPLQIFSFNMGQHIRTAVVIFTFRTIFSIDTLNNLFKNKPQMTLLNHEIM